MFEIKFPLESIIDWMNEMYEKSKNKNQIPENESKE